MSADKPEQFSDKIYYLEHPDHTYTIGILLSYFPCRVTERITLLSYDQLFSVDEFTPGAFVFTDFDRLDASQLARVKSFARMLENTRPTFPLLNHPDRVLGRYSILNELPKSGLGHTAAHRIENWHEVTEFPVFVRRERGHSAPLTDLVHSPAELEQVARSFATASADDLNDIIIVRYLNYSGPDGIFRKYGALRVGLHIYGEHLLHSDHWIIKLGKRYGSEDFSQEVRNYVDTNPHEMDLLPYFEKAGIEYGRADYCIIDGQINLFEINTNPTLISAPPSRSDSFDRYAFAALHDDALMKIPVASGAPLRMPDDLRDDAAPISMDVEHIGKLVKTQERINRRKLRRHLMATQRQIKAARKPLQKGRRKIVKWAFDAWK